MFAETAPDHLDAQLADLLAFIWTLEREAKAEDLIDATIRYSR